ncbi:MAG: CDP-alcohol phosphatidyltransferase family protein [Patescibacteria group bacterium]
MPELTFTDKILARTLLKFVPSSVTPNQITWFRFISIPFVGFLFIEEYYLAGLVLFFISSFSDAIDGSLARTRNQITEWGKTYDPIADKILIGVAVLILVSRYINIYLSTTIITIELFILASAYYRKRVKGIPIEAEFSGKAKMILQSLGIGAILVSIAFSLPAFIVVAQYFLYLSIVFAIISLVVYKSI